MATPKPGCLWFTDGNMYFTWDIEVDVEAGTIYFQPIDTYHELTMAPVSKRLYALKGFAKPVLH